MQGPGCVKNLPNCVRIIIRDVPWRQGDRMNMRKNLRVTTALSAILALFVVLFAAAAAAGIAVLRDNRADIEALGKGSIERASDLADMTSRLFQARAALTDAKTAMEGGLEEARNASLKHSEILLKQAADSSRLRAIRTPARRARRCSTRCWPPMRPSPTRPWRPCRRRYRAGTASR